MTTETRRARRSGSTTARARSFLGDSTVLLHRLGIAGGTPEASGAGSILKQFGCDLAGDYDGDALREARLEILRLWSAGRIGPMAKVASCHGVANGHDSSTAWTLSCGHTVSDPPRVGMPFDVEVPCVECAAAANEADHVWFLKGPDAWEAWPEDALDELLGWGGLESGGARPQRIAWVITRWMPRTATSIAQESNVPIEEVEAVVAALERNGYVVRAGETWQVTDTGVKAGYGPWCAILEKFAELRKQEKSR